MVQFTTSSVAAVAILSGTAFARLTPSYKFRRSLPDNGALEARNDADATYSYGRSFDDTGLDTRELGGLEARDHSTLYMREPVGFSTVAKFAAHAAHHASKGHHTININLPGQQQEDRRELEEDLNARDYDLYEREPVNPFGVATHVLGAVGKMRRKSKHIPHVDLQGSSDNTPQSTRREYDDVADLLERDFKEFDAFD